MTPSAMSRPTAAQLSNSSEGRGKPVAEATDVLPAGLPALRRASASCWRWDSAVFLVQLSAILRGCLQPNPKTPEHPQDGSQTPPEGGPDTGRPAARRRPPGLRDLQGDEHQPRHAQALAGPAAPAGPARRGEDAEQEKTIEHMARVVAEQAVQIRILQMALKKTLSPGEVR